MTELTKADVRDAMRDVLTDREVLDSLAPLIEPIIARVVLEKMTDKLDKTFGVDCMNHDERQETRMDMHWLREEREWSESEEGKAYRTAFKKFMRVVDSASSGILRGVFNFMVAGAITIALTLLAVGVTMHKNVRQLLGF